MRHLSRFALLACATMLAPPALAAPAQSVPIPTLVRQVSIPHSMFRLGNGLTVIVHEDHKAPVVAVSVWYNVGSKDEPARKSGFAHLFEHLMFNGSENLPGDYFTYLQQVGATDYNGTTAQVQRLRENHCASTPAGPLIHPATATVPTIAKAKSVAIKDHVATTIIQRYWAVPVLLDRRLAALDIGGSVLGGLASSRLDRIMVRDEGLAVAVSASLTPLQRAGLFNVTAYVKPGVDPAKVSKRLEQAGAEYHPKGPPADAVARAGRSEASGRTRPP